MFFDLLLFPSGSSVIFSGFLFVWFLRFFLWSSKASSLAKYDYVDYCDIFMLLVGKEKTLKTKRNMGVNQSFWPHEGKTFNVIQNGSEFSVCSNGCFDKIATWTRPLGALQLFMLLVGKEKTLKTKRNMGVNQSFWPHEGKTFNVIQNGSEFSVCSNGCFDKIATWTRPLGALQLI